MQRIKQKVLNCKQTEKTFFLQFRIFSLEKGLIIFEECLIIFGQKLLIPVIVKLQQIFGILPIEEMKLESGKKGDGKTRNKDKIFVEYVFKTLCTLLFFFKFVSRANNSKTQKTKNVALEKFLEQTTLKPCDF